MKINYITAAIVLFLLTIFIIDKCSPKFLTKTEVKIDTIYQIKEKKIYITDTIVKLKYINKTLTNTIVKKEIQKNIKEDYSYNLDTVYNQKNSSTNLKIKGWGYIDDIKINTTIKDTTIIVNKEITKTIIKHSKGVYLSPEYIRPFNIDNLNQPTYKVNLDYINNNWLIGAGIGIQNNNPNWSIKIGYKLN